MSVRVKIVRLDISAQSLELIDLPDIPGQVVEVHRVKFGVRSFTDVTGVGLRLYHDIDVSKTLAFNAAPPNLWCTLNLGLSGAGQSDEQIFTPVYDLIGSQRLDFVSSVGNVIGDLTIHYTMRRESNRTIWNELRARTSFERD